MGASYKILVVDDKELDREGICYLIRQHGLRLEPVTAGSGREALEILRRETIHVLFTDIRMPEMSGHELIDEAKKIRPGLHFIIFTSHESFDDAHKAMDLGVTKYLLKPIEIKRFLTCINDVIDTLDTEQKEQAGSLYYRVITGYGIEPGAEPPRVADSGTIFLLDFVEPFFSVHDLDRLSPLLDGGVIPIPLNEYQCAFIAPDEATAKSCVNGIKERLDEQRAGMFILVYGGKFNGFDHLKALYDQVDSRSSSKFYMSKSTVIYLDRQPPSKMNVAVKKLLDQGVTIGKQIVRRELQSAEQGIEELFAEFEKQIYAPISFAKFVCNEIVHASLDPFKEDYDEILLEYITQIERSTSIEELKVLCINLARRFSEQDDETRVIDQALEIIHTSYMNNISLDSVASDVYLSSCYFSYLFKKTTGMNFIKYLTAYRVEMAMKLLRTTKLKVGNICEMVGYSNMSYFCQIFKNHCGTTPAMFRAGKL